MSRRPSPAAIAWLGAVAVGLAAFGLSIWRVLPGVAFWDTAEFQMVLPVMGTAHPTGYPTYVLLGWLASVLLAPIGEPAFRINVLSAILVGIGAGVTADVARRLSRSTLLGIAAGIGTATAPIVWAIGTHADPHALHLFFVAVILWLLVRWEHARLGDPLDPAHSGPPVQDGAPSRPADRLLLAAAVVTGLSVGNHSLTLLLGPPIILFVLAVDRGILRRRSFILANIVAFAIPTVLVRFEMILRAGWFRAPFVYANPSTWEGFWYVTLGAQFHGWLTDPFANPGKRLDDLVGIASSQFGPLAAVILVAFVVTAIRRPRYALLTGTTMVLTCFFNSVYPDGAIDRYYIGPILIAWTWIAVLAAAVADAIAGVVGSRGGLAAAFRPAALVGLTILLVAPTLQALPGRARSGAIDQTGNRAAQAWTDDVLAALEPNAVVVSWWSYSTTLWYATIVEGRRPDILIIDDRNRVDLNLLELSQVIDIYLASRPVYLIRNGNSELPALQGRYEIEPIGAPIATNVLRVLPLTDPR